MTQCDTIRAPVRHVPALDAVRGIAVLLVMLFHFSVVPRHEDISAWIDDAYRSVMFTGWSGVDLFFVLSGFLITGILLRTRSAPNYFRAFYMRRAIRIFPLYYGFLALTIFAVLPAAGALQSSFSPLGAITTQLGELQDRQGWFWLYASNIYSFVHDGEKAVFGMGHFWSLAIEEQYYIVWSPVVFFLPTKYLARACAIIILAVTVYRAFVVVNGMPAYTVQTFTLTRVDSLVYGSFIAAIMHNGVPRRWGAWCRSFTIPAWIMAFTIQIALGSTMDKNAYSLILSPMIFAMTFSITIMGIATRAAENEINPNPPTPNKSRVFRLLVHFGAISYGLYVFHVPVRGALLPIYENVVPKNLIMGSQIHWTLGFVALAFVCSYVCAILSWWCFESRILKLKEHFRYKTGARS